MKSKSKRAGNHLPGRGEVSRNRRLRRFVSRRIVAKLGDSTVLPPEGGSPSDLTALMKRVAPDFFARYAGVVASSLVSAAGLAAFRWIAARTREIDLRHIPTKFENYVALMLPAELSIEELRTAAKELGKRSRIEFAYVELPSTGASGVTLAKQVVDAQGYMSPAPDGIGLQSAWSLPGGRGELQNFTDVEEGWTLTHQDLPTNAATKLLSGAINPQQRPHGTSVLGIICGNNVAGCVGIAPGFDPDTKAAGKATSLQVNVAAYDYSHGGGLAGYESRAGAIAIAAQTVRSGGVIALPIQIIEDLKNTVGAGEEVHWPIEVQHAEYNAIRAATNLGVVVVEAAGNAGKSLDSYYMLDNNNDQQYTLRRSGHADNQAGPGYTDSGAILVGAAEAVATGAHVKSHDRTFDSNYGSRVDCYAWGKDIYTASSTMSVGSAEENIRHTWAFGGTSGATAIIAGLALVIQGIVANITGGNKLTPDQMRRLLSNPAYGTPSSAAAGGIGVMPDLAKIVPQLLDGNY